MPSKVNPNQGKIALYICSECGADEIIYWLNGDPLPQVRCGECGGAAALSTDKLPPGTYEVQVRVTDGGNEMRMITTSEEDEQAIKILTEALDQASEAGGGCCKPALMPSAEKLWAQLMYVVCVKVKRLPPGVEV